MRFHVNRNIDTDEPERFQKVVKSKKEQKENRLSQTNYFLDSTVEFRSLDRCHLLWKFCAQQP